MSDGNYILIPAEEYLEYCDLKELNTPKRLKEVILFEDDYHLVKEYRCPNCGAKFTNNLKKHCDECGQKFKERM